MKLSCFWHVQKYISERLKYMSVDEQSIWTNGLSLINKQLRTAYKNGLSENPISYFLDFNCSCVGCVDISDGVEE